MCSNICKLCSVSRRNLVLKLFELLMEHHISSSQLGRPQQSLSRYPGSGFSWLNSMCEETELTMYHSWSPSFENLQQLRNAFLPVRHLRRALELSLNKQVVDMPQREVSAGVFRSRDPPRMSPIPSTKTRERNLPVTSTLCWPAIRTLETACHSLPIPSRCSMNARMDSYWQS